MAAFAGEDLSHSYLYPVSRQSVTVVRRQDGILAMSYS